jgi:hypothetical protein
MNLFNGIIFMRDRFVHLITEADLSWSQDKTVIEIRFKLKYHGADFFDLTYGFTML